MVDNYIYIISFENRKEIYIGRTYDIDKRFIQHRYSGAVRDYYRYQYKDEYDNNDWSKMYIDIIDKIDVHKDLTYLLNHPENEKNKDGIRQYTFTMNTNEQLLADKLKYTEAFHILNYKIEKKYNLINRYIPKAPEYVYHMYKFYNYY